MLRAFWTAGLVWIYNPQLRAGPAGPELWMLPQNQGQERFKLTPHSRAASGRMDLLPCGWSQAVVLGGSLVPRQSRAVRTRREVDSHLSPGRKRRCCWCSPKQETTRFILDKSPAPSSLVQALTMVRFSYIRANSSFSAWIRQTFSEFRYSWYELCSIYRQLS